MSTRKRRQKFPELALQTDLATNDLEALLAELIQAYKEPKFRADVAAKNAMLQQAGPFGDLRLVLGSTALRVQAPILERHGLPANSGGVELMKHMVKRRIAEGAPHLEALANEARQLLGLEPLPDRTVSAECALMARLGEADDSSKPTSPLQKSRTTAFWDAIGSALKSKAITVESAHYLGKLVDEMGRTAASLSVGWSFLNMLKVGISSFSLKNSDMTEVSRVEAPDAKTFFEAYVLPNKPVILSGVVDRDNFPPLQNLADTNFLRRRCGHRRVLVKNLAHEDKSGRPVFVTDPSLKLPFSAFLDALAQCNASSDITTSSVSQAGKMPFYLGKVPLREELPELLEDIQCAGTCPQRIYGECFGDVVPQGVFTYLGRGRNTTPVHYDPFENLMLCICGEKRLQLYPPSDTRYVYPVGDWLIVPFAEFSNSAVPPFACLTALAPDLRRKYKLLKHAKPLEVIVRPGDLLYLPPCWWHCVEGSEEPNMILNWWFDLHPEKRALNFAGRTQRIQDPKG